MGFHMPVKIKDLPPGIKQLVVWLNAHGFKTTDSGDGSNYKDGMEGAMQEPMVAIKLNPNQHLMDEADRLQDLLEEILDVRVTSGMIQGTYDPVDGESIILLVGLLDKDVFKESGLWEKTPSN